MAGIVSCGGCGMQYDASGMQLGARFQCTNCNTVVQVGAPAGRQPTRRPTRSGVAGGRRPQGQRAPMGGGGQMGGQQERPRYVAPQKSKTGLFVGLGIGGAVFIILIIVIASSSGGSSLTPEDQQVIDKIMAYTGSGTKFTDDELKRAQRLQKNEQIPEEIKNVFGQRLNGALSNKKTESQNALAGKARELKKKAADEIDRVANDFYKALKKGDVPAMAALIDAKAYHLNVQGEGGEEGVKTPWKQPSTWNGEPKIVGPIWTWVGSTPLSPSELTSKGLEVIKFYYGKSGLKATVAQDGETGMTSVWGEPKVSEASQNTQKTYLGKVIFEADDENGKPLKELKINIRGKWGESAKVTMIYDFVSADDEAGKAKVAARDPEDNRDRKDPDEPGSSTDPDPDNNPEEDLIDENKIPGIAPPSEWDGSSKISDTNAKGKIDEAKLLKAVGDILKGYSVLKYKDDLKNASDRDKLNVIGACVDILNNIARQKNKQRGLEVMPVISEFVTKGLSSWEFADDSGDVRLSNAWVDALTYQRNISEPGDMAWVYRLAYDELMIQIKAEEEAKK